MSDRTVIEPAVNESIIPERTEPGSPSVEVVSDTDTPETQSPDGEDLRELLNQPRQDRSRQNQAGQSPKQGQPRDPNQPRQQNQPGQERSRDPNQPRQQQNQPGQERSGQPNQPRQQNGQRPGQERPGNERPGQEKAAQERPGQERPGQERPGQERPGRNGSRVIPTSPKNKINRATKGRATNGRETNGQVAKTSNPVIADPNGRWTSTGATRIGNLRSASRTADRPAHAKKPFGRPTTGW